MGHSTSASELKYNFKKNEAIVHRGALALGLTAEQYQQFRLALDVGKPNWVTVPRHLDAMTWASDGRIHVLHDVIIPANQKGIEVDLNSGSQIVAVFLPAVCGNISLIRRQLPHVAAVRNFPVPHVAAVATPVPAPAPVVALAPPPVEAPAPVAEVAIPAPVVHHGFSLLPLLGAIPFLFHGGGGSSNPPVVGTPPCP